MDLYILPGACSLAVNIALREAGITFNLVTVDGGTKKADDGRDFSSINSKGYVPALRLDDGQVLTENVAVLQYVADRAPAGTLAPRAGAMERYRLQEWLSFINSELHKGFSPLFKATAGDEVRRYAQNNLAERLSWLQEEIGARSFLMAETFTVADAYLFTVLGWGTEVGIDLGRWPDLQRYHAGIGTRPAVQAALKSEGLQ